jgi:hypothetical protein
VCSKYEIFSFPADSPAVKQAMAAYNAYLVRKAQKEGKAAEEERWLKEAAEERENLLANLELGMYLAVRHHAGAGLGQCTLLAGSIESNRRKRLGVESHS